MSDSPAAGAPPGRSSSPPRWPLYLALAAMIIVPSLFFQMTWFGRRLSDEELTAKLSDPDEARDVQHALEEMSKRIEEDPARARPFHAQVAALASHEEPAVRIMLAWVMGQDNQSEIFHQTLLVLVEDDVLLVRQNAALGLTRFADATGRPILVAMLEPHVLVSPRAGTVQDVLAEGVSVRPETQIVRLESTGGEVDVLRTPLPGKVLHVWTSEGAAVAAGQDLAAIAPHDQQVWEALKGLYLVGTADDLPAVGRWVDGVTGYPDALAVQAGYTAEAIRGRASGQARPPAD